MTNNNDWAKMLTGNNSINEVIASSVAATSRTEKVPALLPAMHVGRGIRYGNLTWFPVFTDAPVTNRGYATKFDAKDVKLAEHEQAVVGSVRIQNDTAQKVVLFEGTLLEGGWQHRALTRTVMVDANGVTELSVVCVEQGRWGGMQTQYVGNRQAPAKVRSAMRGMAKQGNLINQAHADQQRVWNEVANYANINNAENGTQSFVEVRNRIDAELAKLATQKVEPLYGQRGVIVAIHGYPVSLELFDHPDTLAERLQGILDGFQVDALTKPFRETPGQRARDFAMRIERVGLKARVDEQHLRNEADEIVASEALVDGEHLIHLATLNAKHELVLAA
ncbi:MAG: hypothetical protein RIT51_591 [Actinomycetota bacterium]